MLWKERQEEMGRFYGQRKEAGLYSQCKGKPMEGFQQHDPVYLLKSYIEILPPFIFFSSIAGWLNDFY